MKKAFIFAALLLFATANRATAILASESIIDSADKFTMNQNKDYGATLGNDNVATETVVDTIWFPPPPKTALCDGMTCPEGTTCSDGCCTFAQIKKVETCPSGYDAGKSCGTGYSPFQSGTANGLPCIKCIKITPIEPEKPKCAYNNNQPCPDGYFCSGIAKRCCEDGSNPVSGSCYPATVDRPVITPDVNCSRCEAGYTDMGGRPCPRGQIKQYGRKCVDSPLDCAKCVASSSGGGGGGGGNQQYFQDSRADFSLR